MYFCKWLIIYYLCKNQKKLLVSKQRFPIPRKIPLSDKNLLEKIIFETSKIEDMKQCAKNQEIGDQKRSILHVIQKNKHDLFTLAILDGC